MNLMFKKMLVLTVNNEMLAVSLKRMSWSFLFIPIVLCLAFSSANSQETNQYTIGKGDVLEISVWGYPELSRTLTVRPDGAISFPLIDHQIITEHLTPEELDIKLTYSISKEIKDPKVTVIVKEFASKKIWVVGEVVNPGPFPFEGALTTMEAVIGAGGYRDSAYLENVVVIRNRMSDEPEAWMVNLTEVITEQEVYLDVPLQAGDVVYVPRSFIGKLDNFMDFFRGTVAVGIY